MQKAKGADNPANPYDVAGNLYLQLRNTTAPAAPGATPTVVTANVNTAVPAAVIPSYPAYLGLNVTDVSWAINNYADAAIVNGTAASAAGKTRLFELLTVAQSLTSEPFNIVYAQLTAFESAVLSDSKLTATDRQIVLTAAAVARYQSYDNGDEDKYWIKKKPAILGAMNGAGYSIPQAACMAMAVEIAN